MKGLLKYLKPYTKESILAPAFKLVEALLDLLVPIIIADIIDHGIANKNKEYVILRFLFLIGLAIIGLAFSVTAQFFSAKAAVGFAGLLRQKLFTHIGDLSYEQLDSLGTDTLITRITSDVTVVQNGVNMVLRLLLRSPFIVFGAMIMAFTINARVALVFAVSIPVLMLVVFVIMAITIPLYRKVQGHLDGVLLTTRENLTGVRVIRAFRKEKDETAEFDVKNDTLTKMNLFVGRISALLNPATYVLINIATCVVFMMAGDKVNTGAMGQGDVVALYNYMAQMIVELVKLASLIVTINKSLACADRVSKVLSIKPDMEYPAPSAADASDDEKEAEYIVDFEDVSFAYAGAGAEAVSHLSFRVKPGQTVGIIGGTGSGKSTLVNLIPRFYDVTGGKISVCGKDVKEYSEQELKDLIGIVPQKAVLFAGTVRDNLKWGREDATDEELMKAVELSQSAEVLAKKEGGLDAVVEQNGRNFSGGQKQRLTIARALVKNPRILILDDSSSALDYVTDLNLRKALGTLKDSVTVFVVSQRTSGIRHADRIIVLDDGQIAGVGTHEELLSSCDVYREIHESQTDKGEVSA